MSRLATRPTCYGFSIAIILLPFASFLATALLPWFSLFVAFANLVPFSVQPQTLSQTPLSFDSFDTSPQCKVHNSMISFFSCTFTIIFRCHSNLHRNTRVYLPVSGYRDCRCLVNDDVFTAIRSSLYDIVGPWNLQFNKPSCINFLTASIFSSSLMVPNLFSNLFVSLMNVHRMSSNCFHVFLLCLFQKCYCFSAAYAEVLSGHDPLIVSPHDCVPSFETLLSFILLLYSQRFVLLSFCAVLGSVRPQSITLHLNDQLQASVLSTRTKALFSPSCGHACTHKCRSDMKNRHYPLSIAVLRSFLE